MSTQSNTEEIQSLISEFRDAKKNILLAHATPMDASDAERTINAAAELLAKNNYGNLIDTAIGQLDKRGTIFPILKTAFEIQLRNHPNNGEQETGRMEGYHNRFVDHVGPLIKRTPTAL